jgi:hypothetical protein
LPPKRTFPE